MIHPGGRTLISKEAQAILALYGDIDFDKLSLERRMLPNLFAPESDIEQTPHNIYAQEIATLCMPIGMRMTGQVILQPNRQQSVSSSVKQ